MFENKCITQFKCRGNCCYNNSVPMKLGVFYKYFAQYEPELVSRDKIQSFKDHAIINHARGVEFVVYARISPSLVKVVFVGPCPHLDSKNGEESTYNCDIWGKIEACNNYKLDGDGCRRDRRPSQITRYRNGMIKVDLL